TLAAIFSIILFSTNMANAQNIGISADGSTPNANAMLDIKSGTKGLLIPRTSTTSRLAIPNTKGLLVYDSTLASFWYNDGTAWQQISNGAALNGTPNYLPKFTGINTVGNSQIVDDGNYVGIGTTNPTAGLTIIKNGGIIAKGDTLSANSYSLTETGPGAKFIWHPKKAALRAGFIETGYGQLWDDKNIGNWSVALGYNPLALGVGSFSAGFQNAAGSDYSVAMGYNCSAQNTAGIAIGSNSNALGAASMAAGNFAATYGASSAALGDHTTADGDYSFAMGYKSFAKGIASVAIGYNNNSGGNYAVSLGYGTIASADYSLATGFQTQATGYYSSAFNTSIASGNSAFACGSSTSSGESSFAGGLNSVASGQASATFGQSNNAVGNYSFTSGYNCSANSSYSMAFGYNNTANGLGAIALGASVTAGGNNSLVFGSNSNTTGQSSYILGTNLFDGGHKGNAMFGDTDPWGAGSVGSGSDDQMICRFNNGYYFITGGNTNRTGMVANHGDNSWSQISDSTKKEKLIPVNGEDLLKKISNFKLTTWNYKGQDSKIFRHYGPMAQDFHAAFGHDALGTIGNDTLINQADFLGVSFTAIQALEKRTEKIEAQQTRLDNLQKENETLIATNEKLQQQLQILLNTVAALNKKVEAITAVRNKSSETAKNN
ncbi:MAG: tail fiber domain-containing protein, partial [Ferruginibacter sp.]